MKSFRNIAVLLGILFVLAGCAKAIPLVQNEAPSPPMQEVLITLTPPPLVTPPPPPEPELDYVFNPYVLQSDAKAYLGELYTTYRHLVNAVLSREEKVCFENKPIIPALSCLYAEFPLSVLLSDFKLDEKENALLLTYRFEPAEHSARIQAFRTRVENVIRSTIMLWHNECERALVLYRWTAQNIVYVDDGDVSPYNALMNGRGICQSYEGVYRFLLLQLGIDSLSGGAFMTNGDAHAWSLVQLDGIWFHMDPTFESSANGGTGLRYFGINDAQRLDSGVMQPIGIGIDGWNALAPACNDSRFTVLTMAERWEFDGKTHRILLYGEGSMQPFAIFDTASYTLLPL